MWFNADAFLVRMILHTYESHFVYLMNKYCVLTDFRVYLKTFLLMSYIYYRLGMLRLILTATSLPPPVWTHNYCLFKLVLRHFFSAKWHYQNCFFWCQIKPDSPTDFFHLCQSNGDFTLHWLHDSVLFLGEIYTWRVVSGQLQFSSFKSSQVSCNFCALWYSLFCFISLLEQLLLFLSLFLLWFSALFIFDTPGFFCVGLF